jgi:predicted RNase H-like HicB family nuclease
LPSVGRWQLAGSIWRFPERKRPFESRPWPDMGCIRLSTLLCIAELFYTSCSCPPDSDTEARGPLPPRGMVELMPHPYQVFVEYDPAEKAWVTYVPALDHLSTFGTTREEAIEHTREAIVGYIEAAEREGIKLNIEPIAAELVEIAV